ncbi:uncharacterized protein BX663DRAFT_496094 [Cokeromyces recurvatus]|uniref:uncharacterized protein n=1 Tax=Cokeromyces recurvatus TaxID=90255 RepID=UPI00221E8AA1|nr:uncharacterized protein BX663DRAFT_496094 [Cokeromyces recurvatus]KAI7906352.1 hypothetical protein BX663DRAFT_496094 [Cokeromyces recurvatus]
MRLLGQSVGHLFVSLYMNWIISFMKKATSRSSLRIRCTTAEMVIHLKSANILVLSLKFILLIFFPFTLFLFNLVYLFYLLHIYFYTFPFCLIRGVFLTYILL